MSEIDAAAPSPPSPSDRDRRRLFGLAYQMLGTVTEAEDAVQEALARWAATDPEQIREPAAWLTTVTTRICLDRLKSSHRTRETYVGPWLPEPLLTDDTDPADMAATADSLTLAFLVVLESLSPLERAVFLLHDAFGYQHDEIAAMLDRSPAAIRKVASRARAHLDERRPRYEADPARRRAVADAFLEASAGGSLADLIEVLAPDVVFTSDGGGKVSAARHPVHGADRVARFWLGLLGQADEHWTVEPVTVNGMPGLLARHDGEPNTVFDLQIADDRIVAVHAVRNPDKLAHLRP